MKPEPVDLSVLEPGQFSVAAKQPFPRRKLSGGVKALLVAMRIYVLIAIPIVVYAFVKALMAG
jgi:hypothetical protein